MDYTHPKMNDLYTKIHIGDGHPFYYDWQLKAEYRN